MPTRVKYRGKFSPGAACPEAGCCVCTFVFSFITFAPVSAILFSPIRLKVCAVASCMALRCPRSGPLFRFVLDFRRQGLAESYAVGHAIDRPFRHSLQFQGSATLRCYAFAPHQANTGLAGDPAFMLRSRRTALAA